LWAFTYLSKYVYYDVESVPAGGPEKPEIHSCSQF
jgi:hypothetical protein